MGLTSPQFKQLIACPLDRRKLESILLDNGRIAAARETVIHSESGRKTVYDGSGHLRQSKEFGDGKDAKTSRETWPDVASARKAFFKGLVTWINDPSSS